MQQTDSIFQIMVIKKKVELVMENRVCVFADDDSNEAINRPTLA